MTDITPLAAVITEEPPVHDEPYYFATKNGWFGNLPTLFGTAHVKQDKWPTKLPDIEPKWHPNDEKVPARIFLQFIDLARKVYERHKTEVTSYICRNEEGVYSLFIPHQYVTGASVEHKVETNEWGDRKPVGTIHSHCMMTAFHSGTDEHDMGKMPGVHATIGMVMNDQPEYAVAIAIGDQRFDIEPWDIIDNSDVEVNEEAATAPTSWLRFIHPNERAPWNTGGVRTTYRKPGSKVTRFRPPHRGNHIAPYDNWNYGGYGADWGDDIWGREWERYDQKQHHRSVMSDLEELQDKDLPTSEAILYEEAVALAQQGFRLQYTITRDPEGAEKWLAEQYEKYGEKE